jgi:hypothetical protein
MYNSAKTLLETLWSDTHGTIRELAVRFEDVRDSDAMPFFDKYSRDINKDLKSGVNVTHSVFGEGAVLSESDTWRYVSFYDKARWVEATCLC